MVSQQLRLNCKSPKGNRMQVIFSLEEQLVLRAVSSLQGARFKEIEKTVLSVAGQLPDTGIWHSTLKNKVSECVDSP